uniref:Uncharacterized protein n=1 Tax=Neogobius melanostomus TaxID=47308 RepID=A0A8C6SJA1_9GOBI
SQGKLLLTSLVYDVNDNSPVFDQLSYEVIILESEPVNSMFFKVEATDKDSGLNGEIMYDIAGGNIRDVFGIFPDGQLYIKAELDRETQDRYNLVVVASDRAVEPLSATVNVSIILDDVNDNRPLFNSTNYVFHFGEEQQRGSLVGHVFAEDKDFGPNNADINGELEYSIVHQVPRGNHFNIDPSTGLIYTNREIDREFSNLFELTIKAIDQAVPSESRRYALKNVTIWVTDQNDNIPMFMSQNALVAEPNIPFYQSLDRETQSFFNLVITVNDLAPPPMTRFTSTAQVSIILLDVNDCSPTFTSQKMTYIQENTPVDTVVFVAQATDADSGPNSYVEYSLRGLFGSKFSIGTIDGNVRLVGELDREELSNYTLTVVAMDKGEPPLSTTMDVTMIVLDVNDNTPSFSQNIYDIEIEENTLTGTDVIQVFASDADEGTNGQIRFSVSGGNSDFRIDSVTGVISVARQLDREAKSLYSLVVQASDRGSTPRVDKATVNIVLLDVNDCTPEFELSPYTVSVQENLERAFTFPESQPTNHIVTTVSGSSRRGGPLSYYIASGNLDNAFHIDQLSGELSIRHQLDYEHIQKYVLWIEARDQGFPPYSSYEKLEITVLDVNDNHPVFEKDPFHAEILENLSPQRVLIVNGIDLDSGSNGQLEYALVDGNKDNSFSINRGTGEIRTTRPLDREKVARYNLKVRATDRGSPPKSNSVRVVVNVLDVNDNAPRFSKIFSLNNQTFLMAAVKRGHGQYVNPSGVATFFQSIKDILYRQSGVQIDAVDHDPCTRNPCQNGGSCKRRLSVGPDMKTEESVPVILVSNHPLPPYACSCRPGYTGALCETDIDECQPSPCHNGGTCHNLVGGFSCTCPEGFTGMACERDINECLSNPCKNGALCQNFPGGFNCLCKSGFAGTTHRAVTVYVWPHSHS